MITCEKSSWRVMLNSIRHLLILLNIIRPKCVCPHMCVSMRVLLVSSLHVVSVSYCCLFSDTTWFSWGKWCRLTALCSWLRHTPRAPAFTCMTLSRKRSPKWRKRRRRRSESSRTRFTSSFSTSATTLWLSAGEHTTPVSHTPGHLAPALCSICAP